MTLNRLSGIVTAIAGAVLLFWIIPAQTEVLDSGWLNPTTLPRITATIIMFAGIIHVLFPAGTAEFDIKFSLRMGMFFIVTVAGIYLMSVIGFIIAAPLLVLVIMLMIGERRPLWLAMGIILLPALIWFCVDFLLDKPLP